MSSRGKGSKTAPASPATSLSNGTSGISDESSESDSAPENDNERCQCACCQTLLRSLLNIDASDLQLSPIDPGIWDEWGVYYCSSRFGRHTPFNPNYFALAATIVVGQSNFFNLIHLMNENGGLAFLIVLLMTYISFGYPTYLIEMLLGQYSGRKPTMMIHMLLPLFSGLGVALYFRTFARALSAMGVFSHCLYHCWDLLFCKGGQSVLLKRILLFEKGHPKFSIWSGFEFTYTDDIDPAYNSEKPWLLVMAACTLLVCFLKLKEFGEGLKVVLRLLILCLAAYTFNGYGRTHPIDNVKWNSIMFLPLNMAFRPRWEMMMNGWVWVKSITFVVQSLELGSLVHPYLGSKGFFHYRCVRDGVYLVMVSFTWNVLGAIGVLLWIGYVGITEDEITNSFHELRGYYGMFVVFIMKHLQAEMTTHIDNDVLLFCGVFYMITGIAALLALICYLYVLIDSAYPESGHPLLKLGIMIGYFLLFGAIAFPLLITDDGLRHLIFIDFYMNTPWVGLLLIICYTAAAAWSQGMARVLHDFYNMLHLKGYEVRTHFYQVPKLVPFLFIGFLVFAMISDAVEMGYPTEGSTDWTDDISTFAGYFLLSLPLLSLGFGMVYYFWKQRDKSHPVFMPHRDFYKNKYHVSVCFKDYEYFDLHKSS